MKKIWSLIAFVRKLERTLGASLYRYRLRVASFLVLDYLVGCPDGTCGTEGIRDGLQCTGTDMTRLVDRLEALGYVQRNRSQQDRRVIYISITDLGRDAHRAALDTLTDRSELFSHVDFDSIGRAIV